MKNVKAVIFDMDGVIIDSEPIHFEVDMQTMREFGVNISKDELNKYVGTTNEYMLNDLINKYKIQKSIKEILEYKMELTIRRIKETKINAISGIPELLISLKHNNIKTAIGSSSPKELIITVIEKFQLGKYFDCIVSGDEVKEGKPKPDIYLEVSKRIGVNPEECIVIEDSRNGVLAAKNAGMKCFGFRNVNSGNQDLSKADIIVDSIRNIDIEIIKVL